MFTDLFTSLPILVLGGRYQSSHEITYISIYTVYYYNKKGKTSQLIQVKRLN
jgi:hypothetical protein